MAEWPAGEPDSGGQGTVWRASIEDDSSFCVKALPGIRAPASIAKELKAIQLLRRHIENKIDNIGASAIAKSLRSLLAYLPTHAAIARPPGEPDDCLLLLRRYCEGKSLQQLTAPGEDIPELGTRIEIAKRLVRHLVSLEVLGFVHLDPYPDNVFIEGDRQNPEVVLIDLDGAGSIARDSQGRFGPRLDAFEKVPSAYGKPEFWVLPYWYPTPNKPALKPFIEQYVNSARWQAISASFVALTWDCRPFFWLSRNSQRILTRAYRTQSPIASEQAESLFRDFSSSGLDLALKRLGGRSDNLDQFIYIFSKGILDPRNLPHGKKLQELFYASNWSQW